MRYAPFLVGRKNIKLKKTVLEQQVNEMFPSNACARHLNKLKSFLPLLLREERKIVGPLLLILAETPSWKVMFMFYEICKQIGLEEKIFPACICRAYDVYNVISTDWNDIKLRKILLQSRLHLWVLKH